MSIDGICGFGLNFTADGFRIAYGTLCLLAFLASFLFAPRYLSHDGHKKRFYIFSAVVLIATLGVFFAADLFTLLIFFEMMSLTSYVWVAHEESDGALRAGDTYMAVAVIGGLFLLAGIVLVYSEAGTLEIAKIREAYLLNPSLYPGRKFVAAICLLAGFGAKAGAFPLHVWLPKAHPVAPAPASALLSGVLTKTGVYGILVTGLCLMPGVEAFGLILVIIGLITMVIGALTAIFSVDLKKVLACSSVSQIGFMVTGAGIATLLTKNGTLFPGAISSLSAEPAILGTVLHMANHTLVKLVVFLTAGVVYQNCHELNLNKIKGFGRKKPLLALPFLLGGMSLAGIPGFPGYLSKSILHESLLEGLTEAGLSAGAVALSEWTFLISGGATLCYMAKLFFCLFIEKPIAGAGSSAEATKDYAAVTQKAVLLVPAVGLVAAGLFLSVKYFGTLYEFEVLKGGLTSVAIGALLFALIMLTLNRGGEYRDKWPKWLDLEGKIYRPLLLTVLPLTIGLFARIMDRITDRLALLLRKTVFRDAPIKPERVEGTVFTRFVGHGMDVIVAKLKGKSEVEPEYETRLALRAMEQKENNLVTTRSLSYGLMLACLGIFVMLGFILYLVFIK